MKRSLAVLFAIVALGVVGSGCASSQKKPTTASAPGQPVAEQDYDAEGGGAGEGDRSTGDVVPTGKGEDAPPEHVMTEDARGSYNDGVRAAQSGNIDQAEQAFKRVLSIDSHAHQAAYNLGVIAERRGDNEGARSFYRQSYQMQSDYEPALAAYAHLEIRGGKINAAIDLLRERTTRFPKNLGLLNCYADVLIEAKRYKDAIAVAKQALKMDERNAVAMLRVGKANFMLGRFELAESVFSQVLKINPNEAEVYFLRAFIRIDEGQKAAAIDDFKTAIEKRPEYIEAMNNLSTMYIVSGNYNAAVEMLERAVAISPSWGKLQLNYGNALRGASRWKESKAALTKAQNLDPSLKGAILNMAILYYTANELDGLDRLGRLNEAKRLFAQYKSAMGSSLTKDDQVYKYIKEAKKAVEREERRITREKDRKEQEAKRAKEREAEKDKKKEGGGEDDGWEDSEEDSGGKKNKEEKEEDDGWH
ncbi:MAG: tetratricopeptide repeat protein [Deltaproteobacteria bacterium]|nr:tetratricopeptide repeat protein [Deltaproteobacteria bacterium]